MLEVRLIGKFDIRLNGEPVVLSTRTSQSIFAFLILTAGTQHRREKLAGLFWPEVSEQKARTYLRQELWRIRKALSTNTTTEYLGADDISIFFRGSEDYWLDVKTLTGPEDHASVQDLVDGLAVYKGELLPGFYDNWVTEQREHLQSIFEKRMEQLLGILETEQRWHDMKEWADRWISNSSASERAYQYLMLAYKSLGDHARVASTYERCVQALLELDLEPSEQTRSYLVRRKSSLNIPIPLTSFIGRETELKEVADLLSKSRLVTLTGSGGVGKTRLAIQVVADVLDLFPAGIWFLDLSSLIDPTLIPNTIVSLLGLHEATEISLTQLLVNYFRPRRALVIFDNCEHLIEACASLANILLSSCEELSILATSREGLRISGEVSYRVPSLVTPNMEGQSTVEELMNTESVKLFIERARIAEPSIKIRSNHAILAAQICKRLDGIPLAIELAATRVNVLTLEQIIRRLDDRLNLLSNGLRSSLPRHQTLPR